MRLSCWFPVAVVVLVLAATPPGQAQDLPDDATRARVADWLDRCEHSASDACMPVIRRIEDARLGPKCLALDVYWDTARLVRDPETILHFIEELRGRREKAREYIKECVPIIATALDEAGGDDGGPRDAGERWEVAPADRVMQAAKRSNLRSGPGISHDKVGLLEVGDEVRVTGEVGDWLRIEAPGGGEAFIYGPLLAEAAPDPAATASGDEPAPSPDTVAGTESNGAQDIPDAATGERVADWMERCNAWSPDATLDCEPVADQIMASELGRWCAQLRNASLGLSGDRAVQVLRDPERAQSAMALRPAWSVAGWRSSSGTACRSTRRRWTRPEKKSDLRPARQRPDRNRQHRKGRESGSPTGGSGAGNCGTARSRTALGGTISMTCPATGTRKNSSVCFRKTGGRSARRGNTPTTADGRLSRPASRTSGATT